MLLISTLLVSHGSEHSKRQGKCWFKEMLGRTFIKPEKILIFLKNSKSNKITIMVQGSLENSLDLE